MKKIMVPLVAFLSLLSTAFASPYPALPTMSEVAETLAAGKPHFTKVDSGFSNDLKLTDTEKVNDQLTYYTYVYRTTYFTKNIPPDFLDALNNNKIKTVTLEDPGCKLIAVATRGGNIITTLIMKVRCNHKVAAVR